MKDYETFLLIIFGGIVIVALFIGVITFVQKSFETTPEIKPAVTDQMKVKQKRGVEELKERQKRLREEQKQKMRDFRRMHR